MARYRKKRRFSRKKKTHGRRRGRRVFHRRGRRLHARLNYFDQISSSTSTAQQLLLTSGINNPLGSGFTLFQPEGSFLAIAEGTDIGDRVGRQILPKKFKLNVFLTSATVDANAALPGDEAIVHLLLVQDFMFDAGIGAEANIPVLSDVINTNISVTADSSGIMPCIYMRNLESQPQRFKVLKHKMIHMSNTIQKPLTQRIIMIRVRPRGPIEFTGSGTGSNGRGSIFLWAWTSNQNGTKNNQIINMWWTSRITFTSAKGY